MSGAWSGLLWLLVNLAYAEIPDAPPAPIELSAAEQELVSKGKIAIRHDATGTGGGATGIVDIAAPPDKVWAAVLDLEARVPEIGGLKSVERYAFSSDDDGDDTAAKWVLSVLGMSVVFHMQYDVDKDRGWCRYWLDKSKDNDVVDVQGAYQVYEVAGKTRFIYRNMSDSGRKVPGFIQRWLAQDSLSEQMGGIRARAEAGATK